MELSKVFLGGTCQGPDYRSQLIPMLTSPYFNPAVADWDEAARQREVHEKKECGISIYVLTPYMAGIFSIAEVVEDCISRRPDRTVLCILREYQGKGFSPPMTRSIDALIGLVQPYGCYITEDLKSCALIVNKLAQTDLVTDRYLYKNPWLSLKEMNGPTGPYVYSHEERSKGAIVVVLPFRKNEDGGYQLLVRHEYTPPWGMDALFMSSITGGVDEGESMAEAASRELKEETGYAIHAEELIPLGSCHGVKSSDTSYFLYAVDVSGLPGEGTDGSSMDANERRAHNQWIQPQEVVKADDPLLFAVYTRWTHLPDSHSFSTFRW